ncbi:DUF5686 and carboxypeptidase regulatory-like domain-containing protein [Porifericola rhodea]|uniref:DUF5686 and carboxypeptidase regulatory-like domain-containing protein n=1 Tax=Porifericola rhodea TaxID=930972 RepID=UPI002665DA20|nr:DUF5686 and carboxypeptidase regulatory-like domain-containing protein [Porifericola rhodea]WKN32444.1 DUF5686 and carboxypeptidase regulatory-like domain-containing protein [Porifericola rhodea]
MRIFTTLCLCLCLCLCSLCAYTQGIKGTVYTSEGQPLPYATIYIKAMETGASTNADGVYEIDLSTGSYELVFQHLGYAAVVKKVNIENEYLSMDVTLPEQTIQLKEVEVNAGAEDPAYTIMRKAIAKSKFHRLQVQSYQARVYIKGAGRVKDVPFFLERAFEKEGVDSSTVFITESVSEVTFEQPNTIKENIISIRAIGEENNTSPNMYINNSFYNPELVGIISPLSPRAFAYYKFRFEGSFIDRGLEVNKIRVIPRSRGDDVLNGYIYIIEDLWSIHSLNMFAYKQGFKIGIKQIYAPIQEKVWMPVNHNIEASGKILGVAFEYKYLATVSDYQLTLNPDLQVELEVIDEKVEEDLAQALKKEEQMEKALRADSLNIFQEKKRFTRKELRKTLKAYEKEIEKNDAAPDVIENRSMQIDTLAYEKDSSYWADMRPIPLSQREKKSYHKLDSMAIVEKEEREVEERGTSRARTNEGVTKLLFGTTVKLGKHSSLEYQSPVSEFNFNTVEGYHFTVPLVLRTRAFRHDLHLSPTARYAFARDKISAKLAVDYFFHDTRLQLEGGRYIEQLNKHEPIHPFINTVSTLLYEKNYIKLYEKDYAQLGVRQKVADKLRLEVQLQWARRMPLANNSTHQWRDLESRVYSSNFPDNIELQSTAFIAHDALTLTVESHYQPFLKYKVLNGKKRLANTRSPAFRVSYQQAIAGSHELMPDYQLLEVGVQHQWSLGIRGRLDYNVYAGSFLSRDLLYFMDFKHFMGNQTVVQTGDPVASFRLLDYYAYSTSNNYLGTHMYYQFRKFLLTQIFDVRLLGIKENIIFNYLKTESSPHYIETGYSLDNILRFLRVEAVANFVEGKYQDFGVRIGISTNLEELFE